MQSKHNLIAPNDDNSINLLRIIHSMVETMICITNDNIEFNVFVFNKLQLLQHDKNTQSKHNLIAPNDDNSINLLRIIHSMVEIIICIN